MALMQRMPIEGLAPAIEDDRGSGFRAVLKRIPSPRHVFEVGCNGGLWSTVHLLDLCPEASIDIAEILPDRAAEAAEKFAAKERVRVHNIDAVEFRPKFKIDLLILDVQTGLIGYAFEELLPALTPLLTQDAGVFLYIVYDLEAAFGDDVGEYEGVAEFIPRYFGATVLDIDIVRRRMKPEGFETLALVDRNMLERGRGYGWTYMVRG
jgi:hypothetical protein